MLKIIQWNIKGYKNNYQELQILLKQYNPHIIALQETHISHTESLPAPVNFTLFCSHNTNAFGGTALLVHNSISHTQHQLIPEFEAIAILINSKTKFTLMSTYISPNKQFHTNNLQNVFSPTNLPTIVLGDSNSWHPYWGSPRANSRGNIVARFVDRSHYILLNDKSPTHYSTHNTFTHIDLSLATADKAPEITWSVIDDLHGSDHFPILISMFPNTSSHPFLAKPSFNLNKADWKLFSNTITQLSFFTQPCNSNVNKEAAQIKKTLIQSAHTI